MRPGGGVSSNPGAGGSATPLPCRQLRCFQRGISSSQPHPLHPPPPHKYNAGRERGARKAGPRLADRGRGRGRDTRCGRRSSSGPSRALGSMDGAENGAPLSGVLKAESEPDPFLGKARLSLCAKPPVSWGTQGYPGYHSPHCSCC